MVEILGSVVVFAVTSTASSEGNKAGNADDGEENDLVKSEH